MWEPYRLSTLWASTVCYCDRFIFLHVKKIRQEGGSRISGRLPLEFISEEGNKGNQCWYLKQSNRIDVKWFLTREMWKKIWWDHIRLKWEQWTNVPNRFMDTNVLQPLKVYWQKFSPRIESKALKYSSFTYHVLRKRALLSQHLNIILCRSVWKVELKLQAFFFFCGLLYDVLSI
jgi:hypothetical protein